MGGRNRWWAAAGAVVVAAFGCGDDAAESVGAASGASSGTWHVDGTNGVDDSNCGPAESPCKTIGDALSQSSTSAVIQVGPGVYGETVTVAGGQTIRGAKGLRTRIENSSPWLTSVAFLEDLHFVGSGTGTALEISHTTFVTQCQFENFHTAVRVTPTSANHTHHIRRSRFIGNDRGVHATGTGAVHPLRVYNNVIIGRGRTHGGHGILAEDTYVIASNNLIASAQFGVWNSRVQEFPGNSEARHNLFVNLDVGIRALLWLEQDPEFPTVLNAFGPELNSQVLGVPSGDIVGSVTSTCGADVGDSQLFDHGLVPGGPCVDVGGGFSDPDGSPTDIGPYGSQAACVPSDFACEDGTGRWWESFPCRDAVADDPSVDPTAMQPAAARVSCPHHELQVFLAANAAVRHSMRFFVPGVSSPGSLHHPRYVDWPQELRDDLIEAFDAHWHGVGSELPLLPENQASEEYLALYSGVFLTVYDARRLYLSLVQESLRAELQPTVQVPWTITDYDAEMLDVLFDFRKISTQRRCFFPDGSWAPPTYNPLPQNCNLTVGLDAPMVLPAPGAFVRKFLEDEDILRPTPRETVGRLLKWAGVLFHVGSNWTEEEQFGYTSQTVFTSIEGVPWFNQEMRRFTRGCGGTSRLLPLILRVANIPGHHAFGIHQHVTPRFMFLDEYLVRDDHFLSHGDDPYNMNVRDGDFPGELLLIDEDTYFNTWDVHSDVNQVGRRTKQLGALYMPPGTIRYYHCRDILPNGYSGYTLTDSLWPAYTAWDLEQDAPPEEFDPAGHWTDGDSRDFWETLEDVILEEGCDGDASCLAKEIWEQGGACHVICTSGPGATGGWNSRCGGVPSW
jgi:hypothetical protein